MPRALSNGIELEYDTFGDPADPALLLVMGFTAQMTAWDEELCKLLVDQGLYVIRFDNRDCGLSTKLDGVQVDLGPFLQAMLAHEPLPADAPVPYKLTDMAADAIGLLDHLGIERAHIVGASMGGMIVQTMAIEHPERVATMTSIMSTTGDPSVGQADPEAAAALLDPAAHRPRGRHRPLGAGRQGVREQALLRRRPRGGQGRRGLRPLVLPGGRRPPARRRHRLRRPQRAPRRASPPPPS